MGWNDVMTAVNTVGFPIVACGVVAFFVKYLIDKFSDLITKMDRRQEKTIETLSNAVANNTTALERLSVLIENMHKEN